MVKVAGNEYGKIVMAVVVGATTVCAYCASRGIVGAVPAYGEALLLYAVALCLTTALALFASRKTFLLWTVVTLVWSGVSYAFFVDTPLWCASLVDAMFLTKEDIAVVMGALLFVGTFGLCAVRVPMERRHARRYVNVEQE